MSTPLKRLTLTEGSIKKKKRASLAEISSEECSDADIEMEKTTKKKQNKEKKEPMPPAQPNEHEYPYMVDPISR